MPKASPPPTIHKRTYLYSPKNIKNKSTPCQDKILNFAQKQLPPESLPYYLLLNKP